MPANLTPEQLAWLRQQQALGGNSGWVPQFASSENGQTYQPMYDTSGAQGMDAQTPSLTGYTTYADGQTDPGMKYNEYGADGTFEREGEFRDPRHNQLLMMALGAMGGMGAFLPGGFAAGAGGAGAATAGASATGTLPALELASMGGLEAMPFYEMGAGGLGAAGAGAGALSGGGGGAMSFGVLDPTLPFGASASSFAPASGLGGLLSKYGGLAATGLGALAGSQGQEQEQSSTRSVPEWLRPYLDGPNGVLPVAQGLLSQSLSPERQAQWEQMRNRGMGLLNAPTQRYFGTPDTPQSRNFGVR